ncbi:MAG: aminoacyl-tRNA hydrolase [Clostridiales bacterium]|nr:aminoacyl-tRNA hydrolase [Clostridiales bacterium]
MKIIAGLGNPGIRYATTRHNAGFMTVNMIAGRLGLSPGGSKHRSLSAKGQYEGEQLLLLQPQTYMNESGLAVAEALRFYKLTEEDLLVVYDDMDLPPACLRLRRDGSSGGHKGMESIIRHLGTANISRLKIGIGHAVFDAADFVLQPFGKEEWPQMAAALKLAAEAALFWSLNGIGAAMNKYNGV